MKVLIFLLFVATATASSRTCTHEHEHFTQCGSDCPATCANRDKPAECPKKNGTVCYIGCECDDGYLRQYGKYVGGCVLPADCPRQNGFYEKIVKTGDNASPRDPPKPGPNVENVGTSKPPVPGNVENPVIPKPPVPGNVENPVIPKPPVPGNGENPVIPKPPVPGNGENPVTPTPPVPENMENSVTPKPRHTHTVPPEKLRYHHHLAGSHPLTEIRA